MALVISYYTNVETSETLSMHCIDSKRNMMALRIVLLIIFSLPQSVQCSTQPYNRTLLMQLQKLLAEAEWDSLHLLCDVGARECPAEDVISVHPAVYISTDLTSHSLIVQMFEQYAAPTTLNWLVFCDNCEILLKVINIFEDTHNIHGYFTYRYQWILVSSDSSLDTVEANLGNIMNLVVLASDLTMRTGMFGHKRYLQKINCARFNTEKFCLQKQQIFPNIYNGYNNVTMVFTLVPWATYVIREPSGTYSGYYVRLMEMMAEFLNFTLHMVEPADGQYGVLKNGQWTGMIRKLVDKEADIAGPLTLSHERSLYATPMRVIAMHTHEVVIYHKPEPIAVSMEILVRPFSTKVWLVFFGAFVGTMIPFHLSQILTFLTNGGLQSRRTQTIGFCSQRGDYGAYILRSTLYQGSTWDPSRISTRIIYSMYTIGWIVVMAIYTASLVSLLSVKKEIIPFRTFAELGAINEYKLGVEGGTIFYDVLFRNNFTKDNPIYYLKAKVTRDSKQDPSVITSDYDVLENRLITEKYAIFSLTEVFNSLAARSCRVAILKEKGQRVSDGFMLRKNSAYADDFDRALSKIQEGDLDKDLRKRFLPKPKQCSTNLNNVSLENIHGFLYILFGGLSIAFITLIGENFYCSQLFQLVFRRVK